MKYILIDTNCWLDLISPENEKALSLLEYWTAVNKLNLLIPAQLIKEWEKQKNAATRSLLKTQKESLSGIKSFKEIIRIEQGYIVEKINRIDTLLNKYKFVTPSARVLAEVTRRFTNNEAPFHHANNNSNSDALIYLTTIQFLKRKRIKEFVFTTRDADDFGSVNNPEKELHPDLVIPGIKTEYIFNIGNAIKTLQLELGDLKDFSTPGNNDYIPIFQLTPPSLNLSILDSVYHAIKKYSDQINLIPTNILVRISPFKIENWRHSYTYHSAFTIHSNNNELVKLFKSIEVQANKKKSKEQLDFGLEKTVNRKKAEEVVKRLCKNLIFEVRSIDHSVNVDLRFLKDNCCPCVLCSYNRFDFISSLNNLSDIPLQDALQTMKHAYIHFQFGNFNKSLQLFYHVYKISLEEKKYLRAFICLYNLKRLKNYIQGYFSEKDSEILKIIAEIDKRSLYKLELLSTPEPLAQAIIRQILNTDFYTEAYKEIFNTVEKIKSHYQNQLLGGFSSNSNYTNILSQFAEIENFLDHNYIIWNNYSDFEDLTNKFAEGLLTIYSFNEDQEERLSYIDDSLLILVSRFAKRENIVRYYNQVHLTGIKFKHTSKTDLSLEDILLKLIRDYKPLKALYGGKEDSKKMFFWNKYRKIFGNLLLFITISESKTLPYSQIFDDLLDIIEDETFLQKFDDNILAEFINSKGKYFEKSSLLNFLQMVIRCPKLHEHKIFYCLQKIIITYYPELKITDKKNYRTILKYFFDECPKCKSFHHKEILTQLFLILSKPYQIDLSKRIEKLLSAEFKPDLYYTAAIYDIIDYKIFFEQFISITQPVPDNSHIRTPFNRGVDHFQRLNEILNIAFKFDIDLAKYDFQKFYGISDYYDWLINMDNFNYDKFEPLWILAYKTDIYLNKIFTNDKVKTYLKKWLIWTRHPYISELFIKHSR